MADAVDFDEQKRHVIREFRQHGDKVGGNSAGPDADSDKPARRDVVRNRQRVVAAASEAFAERGLDVGYDDIAHRAGVGVGTVYRRFPQRVDLIVAVFESRIDDLVALAAAAKSRDTGAAGLQWFLEQVLTVQMHDRGLRDVFAGKVPHDERMVHIRSRLAPAVDDLLRRAKAEHSVRADLEVSDIVALTRILSMAGTSAQPELWRRYLTLTLDAFAPHRMGITPLPLRAPDDTELDDVVHVPQPHRKGNT
jgi:AcrR family transcriptional regulator